MPADGDATSTRSPAKHRKGSEAQLTAPQRVAEAHGATAGALVSVIGELNRQIAEQQRRQQAHEQAEHARWLEQFQQRQQQQDRGRGGSQPLARLAPSRLMGRSYA